MTDKELKVLNDMSSVVSPRVRLGDIIAALQGENVEAGTPVNAVNATETLALTGVAIDGESVRFNNPAVAGYDIYEFLADVAQTKTTPTNIAVDITSYVGYAARVLTMDTQPIAGNTITIGTKTYTFVPVGTDTADGEISVGADLAGAKLALVAAINGTDEFNEPHPLVSAAAFVGDTMTVTALVGGTAANTIATTSVFTAGTNAFAGVVLAGGTNCSTANAKTALMAAITASDTQGIGATSAAGTTILLTADVAGIDGNGITLEKQMANANFVADATTLSGGVDGTVGPALKLLADATYLYFTLAGNTITGKNWRRMALGTAY